MIVSFRGAYEFLSNFSDHEVEFDGDLYPTAEHAYQAAKTLDREQRRAIRECTEPKDAKRMGQTVTQRDDWSDEKKILIMGEIIHDKFRRHPHLAEQLLLTGERPLIEGNHWDDTFWGVCDGEGSNWLGKLLMKLREVIRNEGEKR